MEELRAQLACIEDRLVRGHKRMNRLGGAAAGAFMLLAVLVFMAKEEFADLRARVDAFNLAESKEKIGELDTNFSLVDQWTDTQAQRQRAILAELATAKARIEELERNGYRGPGDSDSPTLGAAPPVGADPPPN